MTDEKPRLEAASTGYQVHYRGRRLYASTDPRGGAVRRALSAEIPPQTLVIVASPLLGYGLAELLEHCPKDAVVVAVEADPALSELTRGEAAAEHSAGVSDPRLFLATAAPEHEMEGAAEALLPRLLARRPRRTRLVALSGGFALHAAAYRTLQDRLEDEIRIYWQNAMTRVRMGRLWVRNLFRNLALLSDSVPVAALADDGTLRRPTLVVGAGPSVDDHLDELPRDDDPYRDAVRILAVDTAVAPLAARGIRPDLVLAVEAQQANVADFLPVAPIHAADNSRNPYERRPGDDVGPHLICDLTVHPTVPRLFPPHKRTFVSSRFAPTALLSRLSHARVLPEEVPPLGSVGVLAVLLARRLSAGAVRFLGLDFVYDLERTHARGSPMERLSLARRTRLDPSPFFAAAMARPLIVATDKQGRAARTDTVLLSYAEQLRAVVSRSEEVFDISPEAGLPNGAPAAPTPPAARRTPGSLRTLDADPQTRPVGPDAVERVLDDEHHRVSRLVPLLRQAVATAGADGRIETESWHGLLPLLEALDYLYLDFPDAPQPTKGFAGRVLLSALYYQDRIRRAWRRLDMLAENRAGM